MLRLGLRPSIVQQYRPRRRVMASNAQKTPIARSLNRLAADRAVDAIQLLGKALPASVVAVNGSIVTIKFEVASLYSLPEITCPLAGPEWIRYPTQVGDKGVVLPADTYLGGVSGLGSGVADLTMQANLSAVVFLPIANANWSSTDDPNKIVLYGPNGFVVRDTSGAGKITGTPTDIVIEAPTSITLMAGGHEIVINSMGVVIDGRVFLLHGHSGVQTGGGVTGGVV